MSAHVSRRGLLVGSGALAVLALASNTAAIAEPPSTIDDRFAELEARHGAVVGVFAVDVDSRRSVSHRADGSFSMCSTFKVYASARVLQKSASGDVSLTDPVFIDAADVVPNSPVTETRVGSTMTLAELCAAALQRSDNTAGNYLLSTIGGPPAITDFARSIGDERTRLDRWETELNAAVPGDPRDTSTPSALGGGFERLLTGDALASTQRDQLVQWMRDNQTSSLRAGLPPRWTSADKTGAGDYGSTNDVGVIYGPDGRRVVLAIMARSQADDPTAPSLRPLIAEVPALVLPHLAPQN